MPANGRWDLTRHLKGQKLLSSYRLQDQTFLDTIHWKGLSSIRLPSTLKNVPGICNNTHKTEKRNVAFNHYNL